MEITDRNYEEHALDYLEGTLPAPDRAAFGRFLAERPEIARQVGALAGGMPVVAPDRAVVYPGKAALKRRVPLRVWVVRVASAAAVAAVAAGVFTRLGRPVVEPADTPGASLAATGAPVPTVIRPETPEVPVAVVEPAAEPQAAAAPLRRAAVQRGSTPVERTVTPKREATRQPVASLDRSPLLAAAPGVPAVDTGGLARRDETRREPLLAETPVEPAAEVLEALVEADPAASRGFLNLLSRHGVRRLAAGIIAPLSEISPVSVYENNHERVVEIASIPVSRRSNRNNQ